MYTRNLKSLMKLLIITWLFGAVISHASPSPIIYAIGAFHQDGFDQYPLILKSDDLGVHWDSVTVNIDNAGGWISRATCTQQFCLAVGNYHDIYGSLYPLVLQSHNNGQTWSRRQFSFTTDETIITGVYCNVHQCIVIGSSSNLNFIATSHDGAGSWLQTELDQDISLRQLDCNHSSCIGIGVKKVEDENGIPFLITSRDKGLHWNSIDLLNMKGWPKDFSYGSIKGETCLSDRCLLVGDMYDNTFKTRGFIIVGNAKDNTWAIKKISTTRRYSEFVDISCSSKVCVATGLDESGTLLYVSYDKGDNWKPISLTPAPSVLDMFKSVHCSEKTCMAVGLSANKAFVLVSNDVGHTWENVNIKPESPHGYFYKVKCQNTICIVNGMTHKKDQEHILGVYNSEDKSFNLSVLSNKRGITNINDIFFASE